MCGGGTGPDSNAGTAPGEPTASGVATSATSGGRPDPGATNAPDDGGDNMGVSQGLSQGARDRAQADAAKAAANSYAANNDSQMAGAFDGISEQLGADALNNGYGTTPSQTYDRQNGWGLGFNDRVAYGGFQTALSSGSTNMGKFGAWVGAKVDKVLENPWASVIDLIASIAPLPAGPVGVALGLGKTAMQVGAMFGLTPTPGQAITALARGEYATPQVDPATGQAISQNSAQPDSPFGASDNGGGDWSRVTEGLVSDTGGQAGNLSSSTTPSTISSTDQRTSYGFSNGQGVDYADLSAGFGGTNVGARSGWRAAGAGGWG